MFIKKILICFMLFFIGFVNSFSQTQKTTVRASKCLEVSSVYPEKKERIFYVENLCSSIELLSKKVLILKSKNLKIQPKTILNTKGTIVSGNSTKLLFIITKKEKDKDSHLSWKLID